MEEYPTDGYRLPPRVPRRQRAEIMRRHGVEVVDVLWLNSEETLNQMTWFPKPERNWKRFTARVMLSLRHSGTGFVLSAMAQYHARREEAEVLELKNLARRNALMQEARGASPVHPSHVRQPGANLNKVLGEIREFGYGVPMTRQPPAAWLTPDQNGQRHWPMKKNHLPKMPLQRNGSAAEGATTALAIYSARVGWAFY